MASSKGRKSVFLGYVHPPMIPHHFMEALFAQVHEGGDFDWVVQPAASGPLIASARNGLVEKFLEGPCDYFLSVDTDIEWAPHQFQDLMAHDKPIVSGLYRSHAEKGVVVPVYLKWAKEGEEFEKPSWEEVEDATELMSVPGLGMGFRLIKREVFEALDTPSPLYPFAEMITPSGRYQGEDVTFCVRAQEKGFESYLDPSVRVGHCKLALV